jgi:hypothetical protein
MQTMEMDVHPEKLDILMYNGLLDMSTGKIEKVNDELVPSYIVKEALSYFSSRDEFEKCHEIKQFFDNHADYIAESSKEQWFGLVPAGK